jgi:hypothetical protein
MPSLLLLPVHFFVEYLFIYLENEVPSDFLFYFFRISTLLSREYMYIYIYIRKSGFSFLFLFFADFRHFFLEYFFILGNKGFHFHFYFSDFQHFFLEYLFILENQDFHFYFYFFRISTPLCQLFIYLFSKMRFLIF